MQVIGQAQTQTTRAVARPWGYVSARVMRLNRSEGLDLAGDITRFVLVSGSLQITGPDATAQSLFALSDPVDVAVPPKASWCLHALSEVVLVLYSER